MTAQYDAPGAGDASMQGVACPFCGLHCDDLELGSQGGALKVLKNGCGKALAGFERALEGWAPSIRGTPVSQDEAIGEATRLLKAAHLPLFGGLGTEVDGMRAVMAIADKAGGVVDHALSEGQFRNFRVLQTSGWFMTSLTEARNRADLFVIVASDVHKMHPRFFERIVTAQKSMFADPPEKRDVVFLGRGLDASAASGPRIGNVTTLASQPDQVFDVVAALRVLINGGEIRAPQVAGLPLADIQALAQRIQAASYPVFVWVPSHLAFPNADLLVHGVCELVKDINKTGRAAGLSLGGSEGSASAAAVCAWQSGFPLRVSYQGGKPDHDMMRHSITRMIEAGEGDCLVWLSSFSTDLAPPPASMPLILISTPGVKSQTAPDVFIPVGTPGVDHAGRIVRCDSVVTLPLRNLGRSRLPRAADILATIEAAL